MRIIGHGIDLLDLDQLAALINDLETDFIVRNFTKDEQADVGDGPDKPQRLAGRFAAKEAIAKALGTGFDGDVTPLEIEIRRRSSGAPDVVLHGAAAEIAENLGITDWQLSISHTDTAAVITGVLWGS